MRCANGNSALLTTQHVGDFEHAGLHRLHLVAHVGRIHHHADIGDLDDLDFGLAGADGLDDDEIAAGRIHGIDDAVDALRQPAEVTVRCHRADEHAGIFGVTPHPLHEGGALQALDIAGPVIDLGRSHELAALLDPGDEEGGAVRARGVNGRAVSSRT